VAPKPFLKLLSSLPRELCASGSPAGSLVGSRTKKSSQLAARYGLFLANAITTSTKNRMPRPCSVRTSVVRSRFGAGNE
jgi:hypothetical protein